MLIYNLVRTRKWLSKDRSSFSKCIVSWTVAPNPLNLSTNSLCSSPIHTLCGSLTCWGVTCTHTVTPSPASMLNSSLSVTHAPCPPEWPASNQYSPFSRRRNIVILRTSVSVGLRMCLLAGAPKLLLLYGCRRALSGVAPRSLRVDEVELSRERESADRGLPLPDASSTDSSGKLCCPFSLSVLSLVLSRCLSVLELSPVRLPTSGLAHRVERGGVGDECADLWPECILGVETERLKCRLLCKPRGMT